MRELLERPPVFLAALLLASFLFFLSSIRSAGRLGPVPRAALWLAAAPELILSRSAEGVRRLWSDYLFLVGLSRRYGEISAQNERLLAERGQFLEIAQENLRLRSLLGFHESAGSQAVAARVIGEAGGASAVFIIDRGSQDGLRPGLAVVSYEGLVGHTSEVTAETAQVLLIQDPRSRVPVRATSTRAQAIAFGRGTGEALSLERFRTNERFDVGDHISTSGTGFIFPKGIAVGTVREVVRNRHEVVERVIVDSAVDFSRVEEVLVLVPPPGSSLGLNAPPAGNAP